MVFVEDMTVQKQKKKPSSGWMKFPVNIVKEKSRDGTMTGHTSYFCSSSALSHHISVMFLPVTALIHIAKAGIAADVIKFIL